MLTSIDYHQSSMMNLLFWTLSWCNWPQFQACYLLTGFMATIKCLVIRLIQLVQKTSWHLVIILSKKLLTMASWCMFCWSQLFSSFCTLSLKSSSNIESHQTRFKLKKINFQGILILLSLQIAKNSSKTKIFSIKWVSKFFNHNKNKKSWTNKLAKSLVLEMMKKEKIKLILLS